MRLSTLELLLELLFATLVVWCYSLALIIPRIIPFLYSEYKPWKYSSENPYETKELAISTPDLAEKIEGLRCYDYGWGGSVARVSNHTPEEETTKCVTCERYRYFEYAGEGAEFSFDGFVKELAGIGAVNQSTLQHVRPFGGKCLNRIYRSDGCFLLLHTRNDFPIRFLSIIIEWALGIEHSDRAHEAILTGNSLEDPWMLRWEVWAIRFTHGEVDALHQVCYCQDDLCNGDFEVVVQARVGEGEEEEWGSEDVDGNNIVELEVEIRE